MASYVETVTMLRDLATPYPRLEPLENRYRHISLAYEGKACAYCGSVHDKPRCDSCGAPVRQHLAKH